MKEHKDRAHRSGGALRLDLALTRIKPQGSWKTAWRPVQKASGVKARIHDLRHHANTVMVKSGTPIPTLKAITGHLTEAMVGHPTHIRDDTTKSSGGLEIQRDGHPVRRTLPYPETIPHSCWKMMGMKSVSCRFHWSGRADLNCRPLAPQAYRQFDQSVRQGWPTMAILA